MQGPVLDPCAARMIIEITNASTSTENPGFATPRANAAWIAGPIPVACSDAPNAPPAATMRITMPAPISDRSTSSAISARVGRRRRA